VTRLDAEHERWSSSVGAYLLGAVPDDERASFEAHAADCPACQRELSELRTAAAALPASVIPVDPPPALKLRVMAEVEREAALLAAAGPSADQPTVARPVRRPRRRAWPRWAAPALAGAAAAAVAVAIVVGAPDGATTIPASVDRAQAPGGARAELRVRDDGATLVATGLRPPATGRVYQVWVQRPGRDPEPTSSLFTPRADGSAATAVLAELDDGDTVMVTSEPRGGSQAPTGAPLLSAALR
jgi:anti-sigma-K factor RskA